ncbi:hypothetical protein B2J88_45310 [Rhodococcus sp. SRB_17]|nr:hypothetical protein [Rhodococcus sp. SRB_17]
MTSTPVTYADVGTAAGAGLKVLWDRLIFSDPPVAASIPAVGADSEYRAFAQLDPGGMPLDFIALVRQALDPVQDRIVLADRNPRRLRPIVLLSTVMGSRPKFDRFGSPDHHFDVQNALARDVRAVQALTGGAADVIGIGSGCAAGTSAIGVAHELIGAGKADMVVCLGAEMVSLEVLTLFTALGGLSRDATVRPFDANRTGMVPGAGWGLVVLEHAQWACNPLASVQGYGEAADGTSLTLPSPDGIGMREAVHQALQQACLGVDAIGWICAHGTGTRANDALEASVYDRIFHARSMSLPCVSVKGVTGHCQGAAGVIEAAVACRSLEVGEIPPNVGLTDVDPKVLDLQRIAIPDHAVPLPEGLSVLSTSFGFGGSVAAVLIGRPEPGR